MSKSKKDKAVTVAPEPTKRPSYGDIRIQYTGRRWEIQRFHDMMDFGWVMLTRNHWKPIGSARTQWGLKREWRRLFGAEGKPLPLIGITVWQTK